MEGNIPHRVRSFVIKLLQIVAPSAVRRCPLVFQFICNQNGSNVFKNYCSYQDFMEVRNVTINLTPVPIIGGASENLVNITITRGKFLFLGLSVYYGHSLK